jgi:hypothetical protein
VVSVMVIPILLLFALFSLGWIVLLVIGIVRRRRQLPGGLVMIILGGLWGVPAIGVIALASFAFYQVSAYEPITVKPFDAATYAGETGTIMLNYAGDATLQVGTTNANEHLALSGSGGVITAPAGVLSPSRFEGKREGRGGTWEVSAYLGRGNSKTITVASDMPVAFEAGPPLSASIKVKQKANRQVSLDFELKGRDAQRYTITGPKRQQTPRFEIRDGQGEIVLSGAFAYG